MGNLAMGISLIKKEIHRMEEALAKGRVNEADKGQVLEKIHGLKAVLEAVRY